LCAGGGGSEEPAGRRGTHATHAQRATHATHATHATPCRAACLWSSPSFVTVIWYDANLLRQEAVAQALQRSALTIGDDGDTVIRVCTARLLAASTADDVGGIDSGGGTAPPDVVADISLPALCGWLLGYPAVYYVDPAAAAQGNSLGGQPLTLYSVFAVQPAHCPLNGVVDDEDEEEEEGRAAARRRRGGDARGSATSAAADWELLLGGGGHEHALFSFTVPSLAALAGGGNSSETAHRDAAAASSGSDGDGGDGDGDGDGGDGAAAPCTHMGGCLLARTMSRWEAAIAGRRATIAGLWGPGLRCEGRAVELQQVAL
jgi:hypothetical protein